MQMCGKFRTLAVDKRDLFGNVITSHIKSLIWDRTTAAWRNSAKASELELNIKFTDRPNETKTKEKRTRRWHVTPNDGGGGGIDSVNGFVGWVGGHGH